MSSAHLPPCRGLRYLPNAKKCSKLSKGLHNYWEADVRMDRRRECLHAVRYWAKNPPSDSERLQFPVPSWQDQEGWALSRKIKLSSCRDFNEMKFLTGVLTLRKSEKLQISSSLPFLILSPCLNNDLKQWRGGKRSLSQDLCWLSTDYKLGERRLLFLVWKRAEYICI